MSVGLLLYSDYNMSDSSHIHNY